MIYMGCDTECIIEDLVDIEKELSVIIARNPDGESKSYSPVEMIFNKISNQVEYVLQPAQVSTKIMQEIKEYHKSF